MNVKTAVPSLVGIFLAASLALGLLSACGTGGATSAGTGVSCTNGCSNVGGSCGTRHNCSGMNCATSAFCCYPPYVGFCSYGNCGCR